jgi:hypothetical protein
MRGDPLALLARQGTFLRAQSGATFLGSVEPYLRVLKTTPRIAPHLDALREEAHALGRWQAASEEQPAGIAYLIEEDIVAQEEALHDDGDILGFTSLRDLYHDLEHPAVVSLRASDNRDHSRASQIIRSVSAHMDRVNWQRQTKHPDRVRSQIINLSIAQEQNHARFLLASRASGGVALLRLERVVEILAPPSHPSTGERAPLLVDARADEQLIRDAVFGATRNADLQSLAQLVDDLASTSAKLELDLERRIDTVLSRLALVERYRARVEWHDRERIAELAASPKVPEARLRDDLARYLFDQGLDPLTELRVGVLRADIVDPVARPTFFVEAKRQDGKRPPEVVVQEAFRQTLDTAARLYGDFRPEEAFVVIFRTAGPRLSLPREPVAIDELAIYVLLIDLAPAAISGSRATDNPRRFSLEELERLALAASHEVTSGAETARASS